MRVISTNLIGVICFAAAVSAHAQESPVEPTVVKVYRVADLVAQQTVQKTRSVESVTREEFNSEHAETIASLEKLVKMIETIVPSESGAVAAHEESLSLVVRHSTTGHQQIAELLQQLREKERPTIELTLIPLTSDEAEDLIVGHMFETSCDPDTTREMLKILESRERTIHPILKNR